MVGNEATVPGTCVKYGLDIKTLFPLDTASDQNLKWGKVWE